MLWGWGAWGGEAANASTSYSRPAICEHEDVVGAGQREARRIEHGGDVRWRRGALEVRADQEQDEGEHEPGHGEPDQPEDDPLRFGPAAPPPPPRAPALLRISAPASTAIRAPGQSRRASR